MQGERELIERLRQVLPQRGRAVEVAIGDDAAVLRVPRRIVWTIDTSVEGVHFDLGWLDLRDVGFRSFNAAASDIAAMGARALGATSNLVVPPHVSARGVERLAKGQADAARLCKCPIVGGNISRGKELSVTTSVLGEAERPLLRSGARPGDEVWLIGDVGLAAAGYRLLEARASRPKRALGLSRSAGNICIEAWRRPRALLQRGRALAGRAHALVDISDGLASEAGHLADGSGCRVIIDESRLRASLRQELHLAASALGFSPLELALGGGEDYALLAAGPSASRPRWAKRLGKVQRGRGAFLMDHSGNLTRLVEGYDHLKQGTRGSQPVAGRL